MSTLTQCLKKHFPLVMVASAILRVLGWYSVRALQEFHDTFNVSLAEDAGTREYVCTIHRCPVALDLPPSMAARLWKGQFTRIDLETLNTLFSGLKCKTASAFGLQVGH